MKRLNFKPKEKEKILKEFSDALAKLESPEEIVFKYNNSIDEKSVTKPTILINTEVMYKMQSLVDASSVEISWHGLVKRHRNKNIYYVYDIIMFPQINSATATTTDQDEYAKWMMELIKNPESDFENIRLHGHSHVNMSVYSSTIDDAYQKELISKLEDDDYYIFLILNKKKEVCALLYDYSQQILFENKDISIKITSSKEGLLEDWANKMIKEYCSSPKPVVNNYAYDRRKWWWKR